MRAREKSYADYGITGQEKDYIFEFLRKADETQKKQIIDVALSESGEYLARHIYNSIAFKLSYEDICKKEYLYINKDDFYAHRRKAVEAIERWMKLNNCYDYSICSFK